MAVIRFQLLGNIDGTPSVETLSGSGLAFFGATAGSSVQIGSYQDTTYISNGDGSVTKDASSNVKYRDAYPSGQVTLDTVAGSPLDTGLSGVRSMYGSLGIEFGHPSQVNVQNVQLRVYDRSNVNYPASGVNTKVAELINHNGATYSTQGADDGGNSAAVGSGDFWWWGEPWPSTLCDKNYYVNSVGVTFNNGDSDAARTNGDARLASAAVAGSYDTVGGTGIIVPLSDSPGSGQKYLAAGEAVSGTGCVWPKWTQYIKTASQSVTGYTFGDGSDTVKAGGIAPIDRTFGGTGVDTHHTWSVALSATPLSSGSKEQYGLYVSLEYL
jgi:hypothetical protein